jgi:hypothetical protein
VSRRFAHKYQPLKTKAKTAALFSPLVATLKKNGF